MPPYSIVHYSRTKTDTKLVPPRIPLLFYWYCFSEVSSPLIVESASYIRSSPSFPNKQPTVYRRKHCKLFDRFKFVSDRISTWYLAGTFIAKCCIDPHRYLDSKQTIIKLILPRSIKHAFAHPIMLQLTQLEPQVTCDVISTAKCFIVLSTAQPRSTSIIAHRFVEL